MVSSRSVRWVAAACLVTMFGLSRPDASATGYLEWRPPPNDNGLWAAAYNWFDLLRGAPAVEPPQAEDFASIFSGDIVTVDAVGGTCQELVVGSRFETQSAFDLSNRGSGSLLRRQIGAAIGQLVRSRLGCVQE